jgi:hypothetical protein
MQSVANRILASQKPSASAVAAELRSILAEVEQAVPPAGEKSPTQGR